MLSSKPRVLGSATTQGRLWSARARDWADIQEQTSLPLYQTILAKTRVGSKTKLLDVGCGTGMFCQLATQLGAVVSGTDASPALIDIARERTPYADLRVGEMEDLAFADKSFDLITGFNSFEYAADALNALQEARRVARVGAQIVVATWGRPQDCQARAYVEALDSFLPSLSVSNSFVVSEDSALAALIKQAGLMPIYSDEMECPWEYPNLETALNGLLSAGTAIKAIQAVGEQNVKEAVTAALTPFKQASGNYRLENKFHYVISLRPQ